MIQSILFYGKPGQPYHFCAFYQEGRVKGSITGFTRSIFATRAKYGLKIPAYLLNHFCREIITGKTIQTGKAVRI